jgi:hypothetical protein
MVNQASRRFGRGDVQAIWFSGQKTLVWILSFVFDIGRVNLGFAVLLAELPVEQGAPIIPMGVRDGVLS